MRETIAGLLCLLGGFVGAAPAEEPKRLTAEEVEKELAIVEAYISRDRGPPSLDPKPEHTAANFAATNVVRSLGHLAEGSPVRLKAIALARKHSAIPEYATGKGAKQKRPEGVSDPQAHTRLRFAWGVLRETGVLRDGMRLEELVALLGQPTETRPETAEWYYSSPMHVNPCLRYWRSDGPEKHQKKGRLEAVRR